MRFKEALGCAVILLLMGALFLGFNANAVQSGDAWIVYLPGTKLLMEGDIGHFREAISFGNAARAPMFIVLTALVKWLTFGALSLPQAAHLAVVLCGVALGIMLFFRARRSVGLPLAIAASVLALFNTPSLPSMVYTTPDALFCVLWLGLLFAMLDDRPKLVMLLYALAVFTRGNGITLLPGVMIYLVYKYRRGVRPAAAYLALSVTLLGLYNGFAGWARSGSSMIRTPVSEWHPDMFLTGTYHGILEDALDFSKTEQYARILSRIVFLGPAEVLECIWRDGRISPFLAPFFFLLGLFVVGRWTVLRIIKERRYFSPTIAALVFVAGYYVPIILYHWETRYLLPVYVGLIFCGALSLGRLGRPGGLGGLGGRGGQHVLGWGALAFAVVVAVINAGQLGRVFTARDGLSLDDSGYTYVRAQGRPERALEKMSALVKERPIYMAACGAMPLQYFNYHRYGQHAGQIECVGWHFRRPRDWNDIDFTIWHPEYPFEGMTRPHERAILLGEPIAELEDGLQLFYNRAGRRYPDSPGARQLELRLLQVPEGWRQEGRRLDFFPEPGRKAHLPVLSATVALGRDELITSRFKVTSDGRIWRKLRFSYVVDGEAVPGLTLNKRDADGQPISVTYLCERPRCVAQLSILAGRDEKKRMTVDELSMGIIAVEPTPPLDSPRWSEP